MVKSAIQSWNAFGHMLRGPKSTGSCRPSCRARSRFRDLDVKISPGCGISRSGPDWPWKSYSVLGAVQILPKHKNDYLDRSPLSTKIGFLLWSFYHCRKILSNPLLPLSCLHSILNAPYCLIVKDLINEIKRTLFVWSKMCAFQIKFYIHVERF